MQSAEIIPFPSPVPPLESPVAATPAERLQEALAALDVALKEQSRAVAAWRASLAGLRTGVSEMAGSAQRLQTALGGLHQQVQTANGVARRLEAWADEKLGQTSPGG